MVKKFKLLAVISLFSLHQQGVAQNVNVDVNLNIKHDVGGVSDFGRERHITLHSSLSEPDWKGEEDKMQYLLKDLDVYLGRDNGSASWKFQANPVDPDRPNKPLLSFVEEFSDWWDGQYENIIKDRTQFQSYATGMIMGTNPHPTYPTLSYRHTSGGTGAQWIPQDIETSAEWMVEYLDKAFTESFEENGELLPEYWEVINEPDMLMNTGAFMVTSWEDLWEYHNLVAKGVRERMGSRAPKIGGMTWGLHDFFATDLSRAREVGYSDRYYGNTEGDEVAKAHARKQTESAYLNVTGPWTQWDVLWRGFMDNAGDNMDFYSVHIYDWPAHDSNGGSVRSGGHTEAMLEMIEWYDVHKNGVENRKPIVLSEYGAVQGAWVPKPHTKRYDWENLKPFNSMLMQFLERPDYIEKSMPFTPIKATWGDTDTDGDGTPNFFYHSKMLRDDDQDGNWEWSEYIKWYQLWADVDGTRVDTQSTDADIQVDSYIDGDTVYLILNSLEIEPTNVNLNMFGNTSNTLENVTIKHMFLQGENEVILSNNIVNEAPNAVQLAADGTMILKYKFENPVVIDELSEEKKYFGQSVGGGDLHRINIAGGDQTFQVNGVNVPETGEAMLKITGAFFDAEQTPTGFLSIPKFQVNGTTIDVPFDWRGVRQLRSKFFGTLEIPVPVDLLEENNTFTVDFRHAGEVTVVNLVVWEFSKEPGRTTEIAEANTVAVTGVDLLPETVTIDKNQLSLLAASISPANATDQLVTWSSSDPSVAKVDSSGAVTGVAAGQTTITVTTADGNFTATSIVSVVIIPKPVTDIEIAPTTLELEEGETGALLVTLVPSFATNQSVQWNSMNSSVATVDANGLVTAVGSGETTITVTSDDGGFTAESVITVLAPRVRTGLELVIEAEDFETTGGAFDDEAITGGGVGKIDNIGINYVNTADWVTYTLKVSEDGEYDIVYLIGTPSVGAQIKIEIDGNEVSNDLVLSTGGWDNYQELKAENTVMLTAGNHAVRIEASSLTAWQWNLDKITFNGLETDSGSATLSTNDFAATQNGSEDKVYPVPASTFVNVELKNADSDLTISLVDMNGVIVQEKHYENGFQFDVRNLSAGIYFVTYLKNSEYVYKTITVM